jgi:hypothetical protein
VLSDAGLPTRACRFWSFCIWAGERDDVFPALARVRSKRLRKPINEGRNEAPSPQREGCRTFLDPRAEERRGAANASCWISCKYSFKFISCPTKPRARKLLDHLVLVPNSELASLRDYLQQDSAFGQSAGRCNTSKDRHPAIPTHMAQIPLLIQGRQPGNRAQPVLGARVTWATSEMPHKEEHCHKLGHGSRTFVVGVLEERLCHFAHLLQCARLMDL